MASIIETRIESQTISDFYPIWKILLIGFLSGLGYWVLSGLVDRYIVGPTMCESIKNALVCSDRVGVSGDIATIIIATLGIIIMLQLRIKQPLITIVASAVILSGLSRFTEGLIITEAIFWSVALYGLAYVLFSWIARYKKIIPTIILVISVIFIERIITSL